MSVIPEEVRAQMRGVSWRDDARCPSFANLALVRPRYLDFHGAVREGELIVAADVACDVEAIFADIFKAGFPLGQMRRIEAFAGSDDLSMHANNCSAFNFRVVAGTDRLSHHALGRAIDINPVQNPWVRGKRIEPAVAAEYIDRSNRRAGMLIRPCPVIAAFLKRGWTWGGDWSETSDYHHFEKK